MSFPSLSRLAAAVLLSVTALPLAAQRTTYDNFNSWYIFNGDIGLSEHWSTQFDVQERRSGPVEEPQAFFMRVLANYGFANGVKTGFGFSRSESYPFGDTPSAYQTPERRLFEQLQFGHSLGKMAMTERYRIEQRWQGRRGADTSNHEITRWIYTNRV